jgi:hypothetical protein
MILNVQDPFARKWSAVIVKRSFAARAYRNQSVCPKYIFATESTEHTENDWE